MFAVNALVSVCHGKYGRVVGVYRRRKMVTACQVCGTPTSSAFPKQRLGSCSRLSTVSGQRSVRRPSRSTLTWKSGRSSKLSSASSASTSASTCALNTAHSSELSIGTVLSTSSTRSALKAISHAARDAVQEAPAGPQTASSKLEAAFSSAAASSCLFSALFSASDHVARPCCSKRLEHSDRSHSGDTSKLSVMKPASSACMIFLASTGEMPIASRRSKSQWLKILSSMLNCTKSSKTVASNWSSSMTSSFAFKNPAGA
mmetsp:Transcript_54709/g.109989  ORF Transcript_54709/g.109989 Transcript_54709/m.109989 type:complete len:259 (-) Transcript_54709:154-930(-)